MLELKNIKKVYKTENLKQVALNDVTVNFRKNEFVSILGPSGSGKTTLLNIIGGLDSYDDGDLVINEVSTKKFTSKDWDSYRNHRVGFVFQSYNLISHQSILQNVELALTLSGVSKLERQKRAKEALKQVGLEKHINKRPNQLSGGQMQRVAIARALVNDPDILLADEPTGALDSVTSEQIMNLLASVAKDKLVIMVTHNPELASEYSTRIVKVRDGVITDDSNPYNGSDNTKEEHDVVKKKAKKTSMGLFTALSLSLNNLMTKKGRTFLTAFAGSIGIIGIALILSLSNGVQDYIDRTQREALASYPLTIDKMSSDLNVIIDDSKNVSAVNCEDGKICTEDDITTSYLLKLSSSIKENNLKALRKYLEDNGGNIKDYITDIQYFYDVDLQIYSNDGDGTTRVNPNTFSLRGEQSSMEEMYPTNASMATFMPSNDVFKELINNDALLKSQYDILAGKMPSKYNEMVLVVDEDYKLPLSMLYSLNILDRSELTDTIKKVKNGEDVSLDSINYDYSKLLNKKFKLLLNNEIYEKQNGLWLDKSVDKKYLKNKLDTKGVELEIVGILKISDAAVEASSGFVGYTKDLTKYVIDEVNKSDIAKEQLKDTSKSVLTGEKFDEQFNKYDNTLKKIGLANLDNPSGINIYPKDFDSKEKIEKIIDEYNENAEEKDKITYTDYVGVLLSSVTSIVNVISYILIAFVAVSLVVSSIMIAIITYISVLERTKEIGILRAIGASKKDVSRVFNAETIIEGFVAGLLGVLIAYLITIPVNAIVRSALEITNIAHLKLSYAVILIMISVILTVIAGLVPSRMASKKDPVEALRSE